MNFDPETDCWAIEDFQLAFEGQTVTLMTGRALRRELALFYASTRANARENCVRFPHPWASIWTQTIAMQRVLPSEPPDTRGALQRALAPLLGPQKALLARLSLYVWWTLRAHPKTRLWLVPSVYSLRMETLLDQQLHAAFVRTANIPPWVGKDFPRPCAD